jgi:hypothetical protein
MQNSKGQNQIIGQAICDLANFVHMPDKGNLIMEQKASLGFHKAFSYSHLLKQFAQLNLVIRSCKKREVRKPSIDYSATTTITDFDRMFANDDEEQILFDTEESQRTEEELDDLFNDNSTLFKEEEENTLNMRSTTVVK